MSDTFSAIIEHDEHGFFAYCPGLPGCHTQRDTFEQARDNIREATHLYLETLDEGARQLSQ
jgi:predicted RNase H-like HicB family nuclease